jgi:hypothetical protein
MQTRASYIDDGDAVYTSRSQNHVSETFMKKKVTIIVAVILLLKIALPDAIGQVAAQTPPPSYPDAAPLADYSIPAEASEIEFARSAAPPIIAAGAEVLVLGPDGYTTAVKGSNVFVCLVERSWGKATDDPEFWNPKVRAPLCVNAPAAKTYLPIVLMKTKLVLAHKSRPEIAQAIKSALDSKELPPLEPNAMCYMMSKQQYLSDDDMHWRPHMMWFLPGDAVQSWGANQAGVPVIAGYVPEDRMTIFLLGVGHWSDGTLAPPMH